MCCDAVSRPLSATYCTLHIAMPACLVLCHVQGQPVAAAASGLQPSLSNGYTKTFHVLCCSLLSPPRYSLHACLPSYVHLQVACGQIAAAPMAAQRRMCCVAARRPLPATHCTACLSFYELCAGPASSSGCKWPAAKLVLSQQRQRLRSAA
jgi:hypothetical protein